MKNQSKSKLNRHRRNAQSQGVSLKTKITIGVIIAALAALFIIPNITFSPKQDAPIFKPEGGLTISRAGKQIAALTIEFADDEYERQKGLMYRESMDDSLGMLFIFPYETMQSFWMKNTKIPLDMIFIGADKQIVTIHANTTPMAEKSYASTKPAQFVLEVNGGWCAKFSVQAGDSIAWKRR